MVYGARRASDWRFSCTKTNTIPAAMNWGRESGHLAPREPIVKPAGKLAGLLVKGLS